MKDSMNTPKNINRVAVLTNAGDQTLETISNIHRHPGTPGYTGNGGEMPAGCL